MDDDRLTEITRERTRRSATSVSTEWQLQGAWAAWWEMSVVHQIERGRLYEVFGLVASAGETLGLANAASTESEIWRRHRLEQAGDVRPTAHLRGELGQRAMAELQTSYVLSAGHDLANILLRVLALRTVGRPHLIDLLGTAAPVNSHDRHDWISLNIPMIRGLRKAAARSAASPPTNDALKAATDLAASSAWQAVVALRDSHYHRRRPQSHGVEGVGLQQPWKLEPGGALSLSPGPYQDAIGLAAKMASAADEALNRLVTTMEAVLPSLLAVKDEFLHPGRQPSN